jgi:MinD superfamily P-loop ATPase containing an inserted ferredoxin domain
MLIAVASGKGGAGKTTITSSLAQVWNTPCVVVDADVEAPNIHLFLPPDITAKDAITLEVPVLDESRCTTCGACAALCRFKAIAQLGQRIVVFPEMCHGCGGCFAVCPEKALTSGTRLLGELSEGSVLHGRHSFLMGKARVGESMSPPQIRAVHRRVKSLLKDGCDALIDAPPGVSCPAMTTVRDADIILLAAEPTPFGFHDFRLAHHAFLPLKKPMAVAINRSGIPGNNQGDEELRAYCQEAGIPVLAELPFDRNAAEFYAKGAVLALMSDSWRARFEELRDALKSFYARERANA